MSRINFANLRKAAPELSETLLKLEHWIKTHPDARFLDTRRLAQEIYPVGVWELAQSLKKLADSGFVSTSFKVVDPSGAILDDDYETYEEIPDQLPDRMNDYHFPVDQKNILPIYWLKRQKAAM